MFENIINIFKKAKKKDLLKPSPKETAKERLHLVLMQDRANVSADFLDLMRQEIIEVIKKYIDIDEETMEVKLTTEANADGVQGAPALYANIPILNIKEEARNVNKAENKKSGENKEQIKIENDDKKEQPPKLKEDDEKKESKKDKINEEKKESKKDKTNEEKQEDNNSKEKRTKDEERKEETKKELKSTKNKENIKKIKKEEEKKDEE